MVDLCIAKTAESLIQTYNAFVNRVVELQLIGSIEEPTRLNVRGAVKILHSMLTFSCFRGKTLVLSWILDLGKR